MKKNRRNFSLSFMSIHRNCRKEKLSMHSPSAKSSKYIDSLGFFSSQYSVFKENLKEIKSLLFLRAFKLTFHF